MNKRTPQIYIQYNNESNKKSRTETHLKNNLQKSQYQIG